MKPGDIVRRKDGTPFRDGRSEMTIDYIKHEDAIYFVESGTWLASHKLELVMYEYDDKQII